MKAFVLAALLGLSTAASVAEWSYPSSGSSKSLIAKDNLIRIDYLAEFDFGYGTHYSSTAPVDDADDTRSETYGVHAYSTATLTVDVELFDIRECELVAEFVPAYFAPYEHTIEYTCPESLNSDFTMVMTGSRDLVLTDFTLDVTENMKTLKVSLYDTLFNSGNLLPEAADWSYNTDYEEEFYNPYAAFNLLIDVLDVIDGTEGFYGSHNYFSKTFF